MYSYLEKGNTSMLFVWSDVCGDFGKVYTQHSYAKCMFYLVYARLDLSILVILWPCSDMRVEKCV